VTIATIVSLQDLQAVGEFGKSLSEEISTLLYSDDNSVVISSARYLCVVCMYVCVCSVVCYLLCLYWLFHAHSLHHTFAMAGN